MPRILTNLIRPAPKLWEQPTFSMPMPMDPGAITPLGTDPNGNEWYSHRKYGELRAYRKPIREDDHQPSLPMIETKDAAGGKAWLPFTVHAPGSYQAALEYRTIARPKPAPRVIDALAGFSLLAATPGRNGSTHSPARGAAAIVRRLESRDINAMLDASGSRLVLLSPKGRDALGIAQLAQFLAPLLVPYLHGGLPYCGVSRHSDELVEAVTVAAGGVLWCGACLPS